MDEVIKAIVEKYLNEKYEKDFGELQKLVAEAIGVGIVEGIKEGKANAKQEIINLIQQGDKL